MSDMSMEDRMGFIGDSIKEGLVQTKYTRLPRRFKRWWGKWFPQAGKAQQKLKRKVA